MMINNNRMPPAIAIDMLEVNPKNPSDSSLMLTEPLDEALEVPTDSVGMTDPVEETPDVSGALVGDPLETIPLVIVPLVAGPVVTGPVVTGPVVAGPVVTGPVVTGPVVTGPVVTGPVVGFPVVPLNPPS